MPKGTLSTEFSIISTNLFAILSNFFKREVSLRNNNKILPQNTIHEQQKNLLFSVFEIRKKS